VTAPRQAPTAPRGTATRPSLTRASSLRSAWGRTIPAPSTPLADCSAGATSPLLLQEVSRRSARAQIMHARLIQAAYCTAGGTIPRASPAYRQVASYRSLRARGRLTIPVQSTAPRSFSAGGTTFTDSRLHPPAPLPKWGQVDTIPVPSPAADSCSAGGMITKDRLPLPSSRRDWQTTGAFALSTRDSSHRPAPFDLNTIE